MKDQRKTGAVISYLNIVLSMCSNFLLVPMMIAALSDDAYSIYKVMQSFSGSLIMLNLGISTITARAVAQYQGSAHADKTGKENTLGLALLIACAMAVLVMLLGSVMASWIPLLFSGTYSRHMLEKTKCVFSIFTATTAVRILKDTFRGCILGSEAFICFYGETTVQHVLHVCLIAHLLRAGADVQAVAAVDLAVCMLLLLFDMLYVRFRLKERFRLYRFDKREIGHIATFCAAILLQSVVNQVNNNLDMVILGAWVTTKETITMYSSALSIFTVYSSVISVFVNLCFPKAARLVMQNRSGEELTDFVIGPGKIQAVIAVGILTAFSLFGKNFISIWIGDKYLDAYYIALMLMIPVTIPLVQNVCLSILDAQLKRLYRSVTLVVMAVLNVVVSLILVRMIGFWGAALGTVIALVIGHGILMNIYYQRVIRLNVLRMFREIFAGILPAGFISGVCCLPLALFLDNTVGLFLVKCIGFVAVYATALWLIGINPTEKAMISNFAVKKKPSR